MPVSLIAIELVLEDMHLQRNAHLLEWQFSDSKRGDRLEWDCKVPDDDGDDLRLHRFIWDEPYRLENIDEFIDELGDLCVTFVTSRCPNLTVLRLDTSGYPLIFLSPLERVIKACEGRNVPLKLLYSNPKLNYCCQWDTGLKYILDLEDDTMAPT
ncbi:hypothetical protein SCHPADRAFT_926642, partial [Schizopora paradoxa]